MTKLRFAVLHHVGIPSPHFDFVFEYEVDAAALTTFRCPRWPVEIGDPLEELAEHRRVYLEYEGPVSGDRGSVSRVDEGTIQVHEIAVDPPTLGLTLHSTRDDASLQITLSEELSSTVTAPRWRVIHKRDDRA